MAIRQISTDLWQDTKWRREITNIKERYLWLYLMSCPMSKTCGIFHLPIEIIVMETKLDISEVYQYLNDLIENDMCAYNEDTEEIAIFNYYKYHIRNANKPIKDMLNKELSIIKDKTLIIRVLEQMSRDWWQTYEENKQTLISSLITIYSQFVEENIKESYKNNTNTNNNTNNNNEPCHGSCQSDEKVLSWEQIVNGEY